MANEQNVNDASEDNDQLAEELKKSKMRTMILAAVTVVALVALGYMWSSRSKLELQVQEQQTQILKMDSINEKKNEELKKLFERAEANLKAAEKAKQSKPTKSTAKKSKTKKR